MLKMKTGLNFYNEETNTLTVNPLTEKMFRKENAGTQTKYEIDGYWYKADDFNNEGLAETIASDMLKSSNIDRHFIYEPTKIRIGRTEFPGCRSPHGLEKGERLLPAYKLLKQHNTPFSERIDNIYDWAPSSEYFKEFTGEVSEITGLENFDRYLTKILEFDAVTKNSDRHLNNIAVVRRKAEDGSYEYDYAPVFDNGRCFALQESQIEACKKGENIEVILNKIQARPFVNIFDNQIGTAEKICGGQQLKLSYRKEDLEKTLEKAYEIYPEEVIDHARKVTMFQMDKYRDFFFNKERDIWKEKILESVRDESVYSKEANHNTVFVSNSMPEVEFIVKPSGDVTPTKDEKEMEWVDFCTTYQTYGMDVLRGLTSAAGELSKESFIEPGKKLQAERDFLSESVEHGYI